MNKSEIIRLNKDIVKLTQSIESLKALNDDVYFNFLDNYATQEFTRLYNLDRSFEHMNKNSLRIMLRLNIKHRFIAIHLFGCDIEITDLI